MEMHSAETVPKHQLQLLLTFNQPMLSDSMANLLHFQILVIIEQIDPNHETAKYFGQ